MIHLKVDQGDQPKYRYIYIYIYIYIYLLHTHTIYKYIYMHTWEELRETQPVPLVTPQVITQLPSPLHLCVGVALAKRVGKRWSTQLLSTPNLPTKMIPAEISWLTNSGRNPMDIKMSPLKVEIMLKSNPLKSRVAVRRLAVARTPSPPTKSCDFRRFDSSKLLILKGGNSHVRWIL